MKKIFALIIVLALALSFASCGKKPTTNDENNSSAVIVSSETETENETETEIENDTASLPEPSSEPEKETTIIIPSKNEKPNPDTSSKPNSSKAESNKPSTSSKPSENTQSDKPATIPNPGPETPTPAPIKNEFFNANNNTIDLNAVSIKPRHVYWKDGDLYAECFVINGFSHNVFNINVKSITISNKSGVIAKGEGFGVLNNVVIAPNTHVIWGFKFTGDAVKASGADLSTLTCQASVSNNY